MNTLQKVASALRVLAEEEYPEEMLEAEEEYPEEMLEAEEEYPEEMLEASDGLFSQLWHNSIEYDSPLDPSVSDVGYRGPHPFRIERRPLKITLLNTKPPRGVKR